MADIDFAKYLSRERLKVIQEADKQKLKDYLILEKHITRIANRIFEQAFVREHDLISAIVCVYITGLYHGDALATERTKDPDNANQDPRNP